jgi:hypothetical protein
MRKFWRSGHGRESRRKGGGGIRREASKRDALGRERKENEN